MRVGASGKPSQTRVKVLKRLGSRRGLPRSYIDVELLTGRKHQIRVHLASDVIPWLAMSSTARPCGLMPPRPQRGLRIRNHGELYPSKPLALGALNLPASWSLFW